MTASGIELEIPAKAEFLSLARVVIAAAAWLDPSLPDSRIEDLRLMVSEATTNAIEAHVERGSTERIVIHCDLEEDQIEIEVRDHGRGFDPADIPQMPDVTEPERLDHERGLGITLMRVLADETEINTLVDGTSVRLVVYTQERKPDDLAC